MASGKSAKLSRVVTGFLSEIGKKGGRRSRRVLTPEQAREMVKVREARRAFKRYNALCFWSYDPNLKVSIDDVPWVAENLKRYGNREAWVVAERLCR